MSSTKDKTEGPARTGMINQPKSAGSPTLEDTGFEELTADPEAMAVMVADKTKENTLLLNKISKLQEANTKLTNRTMQVFEENTIIKASPDIASKMAEMQYQLKLAEHFIAGGAFPSNLTPTMAFTLMKAGAEMGLSEIESLSGLYILKGKIGPWGKLLTSQITKGGYRIEYLNETPQELTVTVTNQKLGHTVTETVRADDPTIKGKQAQKASPRQKLRYHALRTIASFHLAHLFSGCADMFLGDDVDLGDKDKTSDHNVEAQETNKELARLMDHINRSTTVAQLERVKNHKQTHPSITEPYDAKLKSLQIDITNE